MNCRRGVAELPFLVVCPACQPFLTYMTDDDGFSTGAGVSPKKARCQKRKKEKCVGRQVADLETDVLQIGDVGKGLSSNAGRRESSETTKSVGSWALNNPHQFPCRCLSHARTSLIGQDVNTS